MPTVDRQTIAAAVERYLSKRGIVATPAESCPPAAPCSITASTTAPPPAAEPVTIVDFVCEDDVRRAIEQSRKIYIGPKTIVTPSARDLALRHDTLVVSRQP